MNGTKGKVSRRDIVIALGIICVILIACLGSVIATYTLMLSDQNKTISSLDTQISKLNSNVTNLQNQIASDTSTINSLNSDLTNLQEQLKTVLDNSSYMEDIIMTDPSAWVNSTVSVEGTINPIAAPLAFSWPPWDYWLSSNGYGIGVSWQGSFYNGENVTVLGVVTRGNWNQAIVYFINAESIELL
jgi:uncharacterized coiled-coil protein SlyX